MKTKLKTETNPGNSTKNITAVEVRKATARVTALLETMTFVEPLSQAEQRNHRTVRLGPKAVRTINNRLATAQANPGLLPPAFDLKRFEEDTAVASALSECLSAVERMQAAVHETLLAVGKRALVDSAAVYGYIRVTATTADKLKRTVERLVVRRTSPPAPTPSPRGNVSAGETNQAANGAPASRVG